MNQTATRPASDAQVALVTRLLGEKDLTGTRFEGHSVAPAGLTAGKGPGTASEAIDALFALPRRTDLPKAEPGFYVRGDDAFKVQANKAGTSTYALQWSGSSWEYAPGVGKTLAGLTPMTGEAAARLGLASGRCIACCRVLGGKSLSAKVSALVGYGETCAKTNGWSYPTGAAAQRALLATDPAAADAVAAEEHAAESCCDGTGWTGNRFERCVDHYVPNNLSGFYAGETTTSRFD